MFDLLRAAIFRKTLRKQIKKLLQETNTKEYQKQQVNAINLKTLVFLVADSTHFDLLH